MSDERAQFDKNPQVMSTELPDGGSVLLDLTSEKYFGLNIVGTRIWALLGEGASSDEIIDLLDEEYREVDRETLTTDVGSLLGQLRERDMIVPAGGAH